jgi:hypothetical protein
MRLHRSAKTSIELTHLKPGLRRLLESLVDGGEVAVCREGVTVGRLSFTPAVHTGTVHPPHVDDDRSSPPLREGVKVMVTTMRLSRAARQRLSDAMGPDYLVLDFIDAPDTADIVLTHPVSSQLLNRWHILFPDAHVIVTEIYDPELGIDMSGPVGRILDAGAQAYLPARPVQKVAENVRAYLATVEQRQLARGAGSAVGAFLMPPSDDPGF